MCVLAERKQDKTACTETNQIGFLMTHTCVITKGSNKNKTVHLTKANTLYLL